MLGKLVKHEWKGTYRVGCLMLLVVAIVTFFGWLAFQAPMWQMLAGNNSSDRISALDILSLMTIMLYVFMLVGVSYGMMIYLGIRFYKTMYTDEGYLTHTLPVTKGKLLASKILVSGIWYMLVLIGIMSSVFILVVSFVAALLDGYDLGEIFREMWDNWPELSAEIRQATGIDFTSYGILTVLSMLISPFCSMIILDGAISLGQLFTKHRAAMAIVFYIGITILTMVISSVTQSILSDNVVYSSMSDSEIVNRYMNVTVIAGILQNVIFAVILYAVSYLVVDKKLNME